jgi:hypothetical protein
MIKHAKGINMANDRECVQIKDRYVEILKSIETGKFEGVGQMEYKEFGNLKNVT